MYLPTTNALGGLRHYFATLGIKEVTNLSSYPAMSFSKVTYKTVCTLSAILAMV